MEASRNHPGLRRWPLRLLLAVVLSLGLFILVTSLRIVREAGKQELHRADAIVVFGAAEYAGTPTGTKNLWEPAIMPSLALRAQCHNSRRSSLGAGYGLLRARRDQFPHRLGLLQD